MKRHQVEVKNPIYSGAAMRCKGDYNMSQGFLFIQGLKRDAKGLY